MEVTKEGVLAALAKITDPERKQPITQLDMVRDVAIAAGNVTFTVALTGASAAGGAGTRERLGKEMRQAVSAVEGVSSVEVRWAEEVGKRTIGPDDPMPDVKNVILVMSGKGGVGKSTTATNLTMALHRAGYRV